MNEQRWSTLFVLSIVLSLLLVTGVLPQYTVFVQAQETEETNESSDEEDIEASDFDTESEGVSGTTTEEVVPPEPVVTFDPEQLGIRVGTIPNSNEVIGDFVIGPGKFEAIVEPGRSRTVEVIITNRTGYDRRFNVEVEDAAGSNDGEQSIVLLGDDRGPYSIKDYISAPAWSFDLKHGQRAYLPVTVTVPADAEPGGFYGSVLVTTATLGAEDERAAAAAVTRSPVVQRIGMLMFVTVPGDTIRDGVLRSFSTLPNRTFYESGPINFLITYENTGVVHLNPYGEISIRNMFDEEVGFVELEPWFTMPQSVRLREISWDRPMLYGKYTATINLNRGYDNVVDEKGIVFWVIPWKIIAVGLVGIFIIFFLLRRLFGMFELKRRR